MSGLSLLFFDIEATGLDADRGRLLCCGFKPAGGKPFVIESKKVKGAEGWDDKTALLKIQDVIEQYDIVCGFYSRKFDKNFIDARLAKYGERPVRWPMHIDLHAVVKRNIKLSYNSQKRVCQYLGCPIAKTDVDIRKWEDGWDLRQYAMEYIVRHCRHDIAQLEWLFERVKLYIKRIQ